MEVVLHNPTSYTGTGTHASVGTKQPKVAVNYEALWCRKRNLNTAGIEGG
jgi:hypothetical protein